MNPIFENNEAIKFVATEEGKFNLGDEARIESSYLKGDEYFYVVKSAGVSIAEVPEAVMESVYSGIEKNVDAYLRINESKRKFQDSDVRIGGTRKEMAAFKGLIKLSDLSTIEADSITAENLIKKDKVYPKVNYNEEKEKGASSGTIYLKDKLRESVISKPIDNKEVRAMYVGLIQWLVELIDDVNDIATLKLKFDYFYKGCLRKSILIANPELEEELIREKNEYDEFAEKKGEFLEKREIYSTIKDRLFKENGLSLSYFQVRELDEFKEADKQYEYWERMYKSASNYNFFQILPIEYKFLQEISVKDDKKGMVSILNLSPTKSEYSDEQYLIKFGGNVKINLLQTVLGDRFYYFIKEITSNNFVEKSYLQAELYDPYTDIQYNIDYESKIKPVEERLKKYKDWVEFLSDESKPFRERVEYAYNTTDMKNWGRKGVKSSSFDYMYKKGDIESMANFIKRIITMDWGYLAYINKYQDELKSLKERYKIRDNDYSWFEKSGTEPKKTRERSELIANTATPLSYIKRIGGIAVFDEDLDNGEKILSFYKQNLGITRITYGKTLPDNERMAHSKHFFASIIDLAETLNWDVKKLVSLGGLGIMFAAAGRSGASAHYDPARVAINLTRGKGDGSVAHEMADRKSVV